MFNHNTFTLSGDKTFLQVMHQEAAQIALKKKSHIELSFIYSLMSPCSMQDLGSQNSDRNCVSCSGKAAGSPGKSLDFSYRQTYDGLSNS